MTDTFTFRPNIYSSILFIAAVVFFITAYNSHGYHHADEHYQIIEFAELKIGTNLPSNLVWEYREQIRSAFQPLICFLLFKFLTALGITDAYTLVFSLRLLTAVLSLFIIHQFIQGTDSLIQNKKLKIPYYVLSYFIWFIPFISVRFSSETWGGLFFLAALAVHFNQRIKEGKLFIIGCLLGFSFLCRFQMAFAVFGFFCWLLFINRTSLRQIWKMIAGFLIILLIGFIIDSWFYGKLVFTPWNYFYANLVNDVASRYGVSPWYTYFEFLLALPGYFIGIPLILAFVILIIAKPKNIALWCIIPFFIVHSIVPHKESRFLFPMVYLIPLVLILAYDQILHFLPGKITTLLNYFFIILFFSFNITGMAALGTKSAGYGKIEITRYIHENYGNKPLNLIHCVFANPYDEYGILTRPYQEKNWQEVSVENLCELHDSLIIPGKENLLILRKKDLLFGSCTSSIKEHHFVLKKQSIAPWIEWLNEYVYKEFDDREILQVYEYKN